MLLMVVKGGNGFEWDSVVALGTVFYFGSSSDMDEELSEIEKDQRTEKRSIIIE